MVNFNRKGMGIGQVFIFIVMAITFAVIMIFGYQIISKFLQSGEQVEFVQFKNDLENSVKRIYTEFGAIRIETFHTPSQYEQICFIDMGKEYDEGLCTPDPIACDAWETYGGKEEEAEQNVFLTPPASVVIKVYKININNPVDKGNYLCLPIVQGSFSLMLEGKGDKTLLSAAPQQ